MDYISKINKKQRPAKGFPLILAVNSAGEPTAWISYERCAYYYAKDRILWSLGKHEIVLHGGTNVKTGKQSILEMDTIVAIANEHSPYKFKGAKSPTLTNKTLFERDRNKCAYCGGVFSVKELTRDHIMPWCKGGKDTWENVVTACKTCNNWKGEKTLSEADLTLLFQPYVPTYHEHLILQNRKILENQASYLMKGVAKSSRLFKDIGA